MHFVQKLIAHARRWRGFFDTPLRSALSCVLPPRRLLLLLLYLLGYLHFINRDTISAVVPLHVQVFAFVFNLCFLSALVMLLRMFGRMFQVVGMVMTLTFLGVYVFASTYHFLLYEQPIGLSSVFALLDTEAREASEFVATFYRHAYVALSLLATLPILLLGGAAGNFRLPRVPYRFAGVPVFLLVMCVAVLLVDNIMDRGNNLAIIHGNPILLSSKLARQAVSEKTKFKEAMKQFENVRSVQITTTSPEPATHVLVLGESTTSRHMSLYGYARNTTPKLDELRDSLLIANDVCSSRTQTIPALNEILTFATREHPDLLYQAPNLIQVLKAAGYKTYWLSNQAAVGKYETWAQVLARTADVQKFVNTQTFGEGLSLDSRVLAPLRAIFNDGEEKRFVIVHLLGTHAAYAHRYPAEFEHFTGVSDIAPSTRAKWRLQQSAVLYNQYDNAVRYNDFVVSEILDIVRNQGRGSLTFLSDHGEVVGDESDYFGHVGDARQRAAYEVPLFFWLSPGLAGAGMDAQPILRMNLSAAFQTDELKYTLLDLYQVNTSLQRADRSLFNASFTPKKRQCDTLPSDMEKLQLTVQK